MANQQLHSLWYMYNILHTCILDSLSHTRALRKFLLQSLVVISKIWNYLTLVIMLPEKFGGEYSRLFVRPKLVCIITLFINQILSNLVHIISTKR